MAPGPPPSLSHCSAANEVGTTRLVIGRPRVRIPPVPLLGDRSSAVEHHVSTPLVAALAVEAQKAGHLTGNEEMEGDSLRRLSMRGWFNRRTRGCQPRDPGAIPGRRSGRMQQGLHRQRFERSQEVRTLQGAKALEVSATLVDLYRQQRMLPVHGCGSMVERSVWNRENASSILATHTHAGLVIW